MRAAPCGPELRGSHEEIRRDSGRECEDCVHPPEASVDAEHLRGRREHSGSDTGGAAVEPVAQIQAHERDEESGNNGDRAQRGWRRLDQQRQMGQGEVEWCATAVHDHRPQHVEEGLGSDEPSQGLILEDRLPPDVDGEPDGEQQHRHADTPADREAVYRLMRTQGEPRSAHDATVLGRCLLAQQGTRWPFGRAEPYPSLSWARPSRVREEKAASC